MAMGKTTASVIGIGRTVSMWSVSCTNIGWVVALYSGKLWFSHLLTALRTDSPYWVMLSTHLRFQISFIPFTDTVSILDNLSTIL
jgi:hypothetical protein